MAKKTQVDTPWQGSWAQQEQERPKTFKPSGLPIFQEEDRLIRSRQLLPIYSPEDAARAYEMACKEIP